MTQCETKRNNRLVARAATVAVLSLREAVLIHPHGDVGIPEVRRWSG
ncbi:hypothetical protein [Candidatus Oscillochloris fontis]|nr:hypothetical protein [Candidatus Oscillochloris fontis]